MRRVFINAIMATLFMIIMLLPLQVNAHSPSSMELDYDYDTQVLTVVISHSVSNPNSHYVYLIEIWKNDVSYTTRNYESQTDSSKQTDTFDIEAEEGDVIEVKGSCNQGGSVTDQIIVTASSTTTIPTNTDTTPTNSPPPDGLTNLTMWLLIGSIGAVLLVVAVIFMRRR